jgi:hypothetical protein
MKKKNILIMTVAFCMYLCLGCSSTDPSTEIPETSEIPKITEPLSDADITIPSVLVGEELAQVQTEIATTDNGDGTVTYSLNGEALTDILNQIAADIADSIQTILDDDDRYPDITAITPNEDYTSFTISLKNGQMSIYESMLVMSFYTVGNRYQIYNGVPADEAVTTVIYINDSDGSVVSESDSTSMTSQQ